MLRQKREACTMVDGEIINDGFLFTIRPCTDDEFELSLEAERMEREEEDLAEHDLEDILPLPLAEPQSFATDACSVAIRRLENGEWVTEQEPTCSSDSLPLLYGKKGDRIN